MAGLAPMISENWYVLEVQLLLGELVLQLFDLPVRQGILDGQRDLAGRLG
jgi:hypothetical protein